MTADGEGFLYPRVDGSRCVDCGLCETMCQSRNPLKGQHTPKAYACYTKDAVRMASSSGGVFSLLGRRILARGGLVFGAAFDETLRVSHIAVENEEELPRLQGSKYVQSAMGQSFCQVKEALHQGRRVLFSGTPCQVDGLRHYLNKDYDNLYTVDVICHGVPSPLVWEQYRKDRESQYGGAVSSRILPAFRDKTRGWENYRMKLTFENGEVYTRDHQEDAFCKAFLHNLSLRPSCYRCASKGINRNSDLTLGDFWRVERVLPDFSDGKGVSLVLAHTRKGEELLRGISPQLTAKAVDLTQAVSYNASLTNSASVDIEKRGAFFAALGEEPFERLVHELTKPPLYQRVLRIPKKIVKKIIRGGSQ